LRGATDGTQRVSLERHHLPRWFLRIALIAAIALLVDGMAAGSSPHSVLASETSSAPTAAAAADSLGSTAGTQTAGTNPVVADALVPKTTTYTEGSSRFTWSGRWTFTSYKGYLGGRAKYSNAKGASATFRFTGTRVSWIGPAGPTRGQARVYVDGVYKKTVSAYASSFVARKTLYAASWSTQRAHTVKIVVVGTARHPTVAIDAMVIRSLVTGTAPPPPSSPPPSTPPASGYRSSGPITITSSNVVIDGVSVASSGQSGIGIVAEGTASNPIQNITIRNCKVKGFRLGIEVRHAKNVTVQNCFVSDADYVGIGYYSVVGGRITGNTVQRIGMTRTNFSTGIGNNAYGIILDRNSGASLTTDPRVTSVTVDHNLVEDVPLWMGINTHAGAHLNIASNVVRRTPRAIFIAGDGGGNNPIDVTINANRLESPVTKSGGTTNIEGILISHLTGGAITNNAVARAYGSPNGTDYGGASTGITRFGNVPI
jgi:hypothetical protein